MTTPSRPVVRVESLTLVRDGIPVLDRVDLCLNAGECVAVLGASGGGKSTLIRAVAGLEIPAHGTVQIEGPVAIVPQDPALFDFDDVRVGDNLRLARPDLSDDELRRLLEAVGLSGIGPDARPDSLSGGQRRRVAIARALAARPALLLYDEPTAGLDPPTAGVVASLIRQTATAYGLASLVVTHDSLAALHVADRIFILERSTHRLHAATGEGWPRPASDPACARTRAWARELEELLARPSVPAAPLAAEVPVPVAAPCPAAPPCVLRPVEELGKAARVLAGALSVERDGAIGRRLGRMLPGALGLATLGGFSAGAIVALQSASGLARFEATYLLPEVATVSMVREIVPLLVGLLLAGRVGASIAAETGTLAHSGQIDVLAVLGRSPARLIASPLLWAAGATFPVANLAGVAAGLGGLIAAGWLLGLNPTLLVAGIERALCRSDVMVAMVKGLLFGLAVVLSSYLCGLCPKRTPQELGDGVTRGVVRSQVAVVLLDCLLARLLPGS